MESALFETTLGELGSVTSNLTDKHKGIRFENDYDIKFSSAAYNPERNYIQLDFAANATFGGTSRAPRQKRGRGQSANQYTLSVRFYDVKGLLPPSWGKANQRARVNALETIMDQCDVKFYSSDDSFFYQGAWEQLDSMGLSIYQFPGPRGKGIWKDIHRGSGGLSGGAYLTKHLSQLIDELDEFLPIIAKALKINDTGGASGTTDVETQDVEVNAVEAEPTTEIELESESNEADIESEEEEIEDPDDNDDVLADQEMQDTIRKFHKMHDSIKRRMRRLSLLESRWLAGAQRNDRFFL